MYSEYITKSTEETIDLGRKLAGRLVGGDTILLYGELGAGKTHFTKGIGEGLGIEMTIKSPTFAYVNRYPIVKFQIPSAAADQINPKSKIQNSKYFYHYDFYRMEEGADLTSLGYEETIHDPNAINVVEWADRLGENLPSHYILVSLEGVEDERTIRIEFKRSSMLPESEIEAYYEHWSTPIHVRDHCKQVANVAMQIAKAYMDKGEIINANLLYVSCMLHDMCRVCDFRSLDRSKFEEEVTDEKWQKWEKCREQYKDFHHADIAYKQLKKRGFFETAEVIRLHRSSTIVKEFSSFDTLEKKITYYADKRVKHTEVVDLKERFRDGRERYGEFNNEDEKRLFDLVEEKTHELERELFEGLDIQPSDL